MAETHYFCANKLSVRTQEIEHPHFHTIFCVNITIKEHLKHRTQSVASTFIVTTNLKLDLIHFQIVPVAIICSKLLTVELKTGGVGTEGQQDAGNI